MKVLLVSYFYNPINNAGAIRWRKFTDELKLNHHEIVVLTGPWVADSSPKESTPSVYYLKPLLGNSTTSEPSTPESSTKIKSNLKKILPFFLFIDSKFFWSLNVFFWFIKNSKKGILKDPKVKIIVSGTPWSSVVFTALACTVLRRDYFVDFRDFWSNEPFLNFKGSLARKYFQCLESWVVKRAKGVFTVNTPIQLFLAKKNPKKAFVFEIGNGFTGTASWTSADFNSVAKCKKRILYAGSLSIYHGFAEFLNLLNLKQTPPICFVGTDHIGLVKQYPLTVEPSVGFEEIDEKLKNEGVLLLTLGREATHYTTAKLISYLKAGRPILFYGPENSPAAELILKLNLGWVIPNGNQELLQKTVLQIKEHFEKEIPFSFSPKTDTINEHSVKQLTKKLETLLLSEGV